MPETSSPTHPSPHPPTLGLILAGGRARRMGGAEKALIPIGGVTILDRVLARLRPACAAMALNANGDPARYALFGLPVVTDGVPDFAGPLAGVLAGLDWAAQYVPEIAWMATAPADCPFLPANLVPRLHEARAAAGMPLACAASGGRRHHACGLWPVALREELRAALGAGTRRVEEWTARHGIAVAEWPAEPADPFFNVNTPEDMALAEKLAQQIGA
jgi:molybdenum cofactor guanylyltransferase